MSTEMWAQVRRERLRLANDIGALGAEQWAMPSLCARWCVAHVAGHLVFLAEGSQVRGTWYMWRYGRGVLVNRMIDDSM